MGEYPEGGRGRERSEPGHHLGMPEFLNRLVRQDFTWEATDPPGTPWGCVARRVTPIGPADGPIEC